MYKEIKKTVCAILVPLIVIVNAYFKIGMNLGELLIACAPFILEYGDQSIDRLADYYLSKLTEPEEEPEKAENSGEDPKEGSGDS